MKSLTASAAVKGWCSTKRDINGIHIRGPYADPWVGFYRLDILKIDR